MPSIQDMMEMADLLKVSQIGIVQDRCVAVRNRNAECRKCEEVCFAAAVTVEQNVVSIDPAVCVNCGACVAVCPTDALIPLDPPQDKVAQQVLETTARAHGLSCIACARKMSHHGADEEKVVEVPCLAHVSERLFTHLAAYGAEDIMLVDGDCATCKYGAVSLAIDDTVENAIRLLESVGSDAMIVRTSEFPDELKATHSTNLRGSDRRGLMRQTGSYLKNVATNVAQKAIDDKLGTSKQPLTLRERLSAGKSGKMPPIEATVNMQMLGDLESIGQPVQDRIDTRRFGNVHIDTEKCSGCGLCVLFCPTRALLHAEYDQPEAEDMRYLEFRAADCTQCNLCADVCLRKCLEVSSEVALEDLFDFEPQLLEIPKPKERTNFFNR